MRLMRLIGLSIVVLIASLFIGGGSISVGSHKLVFPGLINVDWKHK